MAVVTLSHNITRQEDFEGTPAGTVGSTGGGPAAGASVGMAYEGASAAASQALSRRIASASSDHGFDYAHDDIGTVNMYNSGFHVWLAKTYTSITALNPAGMEIAIGDADGSMYRLQAGDDGTMGDDADFEYPPSGGYVVSPWEPRVNAWHTEGRETAPNISIADTVEVIYNVAATTGAGVSAAMDSIDYTTDGLFLVGGDTAPAGRFQDFVVADQGRGLSGAGRAGIWRSSPAGLLTYLTNVIGRTDTGTVTLTVFTDSGFTIVFPGGYLSEGRNGIEFDLGNASTVITLTDGTIKGSDKRFGGRSKIKRYFDTELDVNATTDRITILGHGFRTGDAVIYSPEGGTEDIGPDATTGEAEFNTAGTIGTGAYWYVIKFNDDEFQLAATVQNAFASSPTAVALTASTAGNGENHSLTRAPDTRPNVLFTGSSGSAALTRVSLTLTRIITLRSSVTLTRCVISQGRQLILNDATLNTCIIAAPTTSIGEAYLQAIHANDLDLIDGTSFTSGGLGHAIEITTDGTVAQDTAALLNVGFSDYFATDEDNTGGWSFNALNDVTGGTIDTITITGHSFVSGDPVYYSDEGGTAITELTDQALYYIEKVDANTIQLHLSDSSAIAGTNPISLTPGSDETHKLYSGNAAIFNNTGTAITIGITTGDTPTIRNSAGSTTVVQNVVNVTVTVKDTSGTAVQNASVFVQSQAGPFDDNSQILRGFTNGSGIATTTFNYTGDLTVVVWVKKKGFEPFDGTGLIENTGLSVNVRFEADRNQE